MSYKNHRDQKLISEAYQQINVKEAIDPTDPSTWVVAAAGGAFKAGRSLWQKATGKYPDVKAKYRDLYARYQNALKNASVAARRKIKALTKVDMLKLLMANQPTISVYNYFKQMEHEHPYDPVVNPNTILWNVAKESHTDGKKVIPQLLDSNNSKEINNFLKRIQP